MTATFEQDVEPDTDLGVGRGHRGSLSSVAMAVLDGKPLPPRGSSSKTLREPWPWVDGAVCTVVDADTSTAMVEASTQADGEDLAAAWCARCPVAMSCLAAGRATLAWGLWGGVVLVNGSVAPIGRLRRRPTGVIRQSPLEHARHGPALPPDQPAQPLRRGQRQQPRKTSRAARRRRNRSTR